MYRNGSRPIRKCGKCKLNFKTHCGLFSNPHEMWNKHRKCPGHMSEKHFRQYTEEQERLAQASKPAESARRRQAKLRKTEPHHDGMKPHRQRNTRR
jgi:hypothetical protein